MKHTAIIEELHLCGCSAEGDLTLSIDNYRFKAYYQAPDSFIIDYLKITNFVDHKLVYDSLHIQKEIDLHLVYGIYKNTHDNCKLFECSLNKSGGTVKGEVLEIIDTDTFVTDIGLAITIINEQDICNLKTGKFIESTGTYQIYFPNTEFDY